MSDKPAGSYIEDLLNPVYPAEIVAAMEAVKPMADAVEFNLDRFMAQAATEVGLDDFGDDLFVEPFTVYCASLRDEAVQSDLGKLSAAAMITSYLKNRLLAEDLLRRNPEIHDVEIKAPIVIVGLPRTGTTHLHNLISSDPEMRSLPYWESVEPVPPLAEQHLSYPIHTDDPRYRRTVESLAGLNASLPHFKRMHDMYADHVHEEIQLLGIGGSTMLHETVAEVPSWQKWYLETDQTPFYEYMKTMLKICQWQRGGTRWILKSPQHLEQFKPLMNVFPDATFIVPHRDPVSVTASFITMNTYTGRMSRPPHQLRNIGHYWSDRIEKMLASAVRDREVLPADQSIDVLFHEFMADDIAMVRRIYALADQPFTDETAAAMAQFMVDHPRGKYGRVFYDLADFDIDPSARREALSFYTDRFPVAIEDE